MWLYRAKHGHDDLVKYFLLVPFYWLAMSIAAWIAFYKFIAAPHFWSKTRHGLHLSNQKTAKSALNKIGDSLIGDELVKKIPVVEYATNQKYVLEK